jgi:hypothetical protein
VAELHLFLSRSAQANIARCDRLRDAVEQLAAVIVDISSTPAEHADWINEADWLLNEMGPRP